MDEGHREDDEHERDKPGVEPLAPVIRFPESSETHHSIHKREQAESHTDRRGKHTHDADQWNKDRDCYIRNNAAECSEHQRQPEGPVST